MVPWVSEGLPGDGVLPQGLLEETAIKHRRMPLWREGEGSGEGPGLGSPIPIRCRMDVPDMRAHTHTSNGNASTNLWHKGGRSEVSAFRTHSMRLSLSVLPSMSSWHSSIVKERASSGVAKASPTTWHV
eukprot:10070272-Alexandrium_andersonii.AAC.1